MKQNILPFVLCLVFTACQSQKTDTASNYADWPVYGGDKASSRYSGLSQINKTNAHQLQVAWIYRTGDADTLGNRSQIQCQPIVINGILYATSPQKKAFALDAATGQNLWTFDPLTEIAEGEDSWAGVNRGLTYWSRGAESRIFFSVGPYVFALDAKSGKPIRTFGRHGRIELAKDLDTEKKDFFIVSNTPGIIYKDLLIIGSRVSEGPDAGPGHIRAYHVKTGRRVWIFHTIPHPGEYGYDSWEDKDAWKTGGGANSWPGMALDEQKGIVYVPTGSASFDFYGGNRKGNNLFANCLLALKADTGERLWHYQFVHHDLWDRDLPSTPNLVNIRKDGKWIEAVAQVTKTGHVFVFDRLTGEPVFPIEEIPVPTSDLAGEQASPTQPIPVLPKPFMRQVFTEADITTLSAEAHQYVLERFRKYRSGHMFTPPSKQGTVIFPGFDGGANWGGAAFDSTSGLLYINSNEVPWVLTMVDIEQKQAETLADVGQNIYQRSCLSCHGKNLEGNDGSIPSLKNLKNTYNAIQLTNLLNNGKGMMPSFRQLKDDEKEALAAYLLEMESKQEVMGQAEAYAAAVPYGTTGYNKFTDPEGYPSISPPWGTLNAIDLGTGEIRWCIPFGEDPALTRKGLPPTGLESYGGCVVTAGGVLFIGASKDETFRVFDKDSGQLLWQTRLPAAGYATPCTYSAGGKQYVVIAAGGGKLGTKSGDSYVAFSLR